MKDRNQFDKVDRQTVMIVGASRGIGLECVKQYSHQGHNVIATYRNLDKSPDLQATANQYKNVTLEPLDITEETAVKTLSESMNGAIDTLIINAGVGSQERTLNETSSSEMLRLFKTNALGHFLIAKYFVNHVAKSERKQIVSLSSRMGSIADNMSGAAYAYRASKSAVNAIMKSLAYDVSQLGIHVLIFHPGWVKTDFTHGAGNLTVTESVQRLQKAINRARDYDSGCFLSHDGSVLPW